MSNFCRTTVAKHHKSDFLNSIYSSTHSLENLKSDDSNVWPISKCAYDGANLLRAQKKICLVPFIASDGCQPRLA